MTTSTIRSSSVALAVLLPALSSCSFGLRRVPQHVDDPSRPIECSRYGGTPAADLIFAGIAVGVAAAANDTAHCTGFFCDSGGQDRGSLDGIKAVAIGAAAIYGIAAIYGFSQVNRCQAALDLNSRCMSGDRDSCLALSPTWSPAPPQSTMPVPAAVPAGPTPERPATP